MVSSGIETIEICFPDFLHGTFTALQRRTLAGGKKWAEAYRVSAKFPDAVTLDVPRGAIIHTFDATDLGAIIDALEWSDAAAVRRAFENHVQFFPWGALASVLGHWYPNSVERVSRRIKHLLSFWEALDTLRYVDRGPIRQLTLSELVQNHYGGLVRNWCERPTGDVKADLAAVLARLTAASGAEVRQRVASALVATARSDRRTRNVPTLTDPSWVAERVAALEPSTIQDLETAYEPRLLRQLFIWEPNISRD